ncbi:FkbM family methyltransferase [Hymenobacter lucidus]|uniref:FkbM family methyltransferase n=1 Tax=Hymenobacter lucidus TaxID=2880930 RepID=A0ABS8AWH3_9BACT|nr:FkbM family methyltransferase [Hymenobacter lucidus]MCB2410154.1 FkbM family methyltransferase [Hymenobacter lucidus]
MKQAILKAIRSFLKSVKVDYPRYLVLKPLFKLNGEVLNGFTSLNNDRYFIYNVNGTFLPSDALHWFNNYKKFENWCDNTALYQYQVKPGDTIIDIGAGIGEEIIVLSKRIGSTGKVYAIEANPDVSEVLQKVKYLNNLNNTEVYNIAIGSTNGDVELVNAGDSSLGGTIGDVAPSLEDKTYTVKGYRLDTFLEEHNITSIDLLKCNIEGAERFVVDSISGAHINKIKNVAIACHDFRYRVDGNEFFRTKEYVSKFLIDNGFEITSQHTGEGHVDDYVYGINKNI